MSKGRIILADDHELFRRGMRQLLETEDYEVVAEAGNGSDALARAADTEADIILLDIGMPGEVDGLEAARRLAEGDSELKVVMLTVRGDLDALFSSIGAGARGYIAKDASSEQLFAAIDVIMHGGTVLSSSVAGGLGEGIRTLDYRPGSYAQQSFDLSDRELEILRLLATSRSPEQIAGVLFLSKKTVQNHLSSIYRKLGVKNRAEAVIKAIEMHLVERGRH
jgi:DNA-binding NarL/FixJ family response regulator